MPIYEYECPHCGRIEVIQKASEKALTQCPNCKEAGRKNKLEKLVSSSAFHLKGSGWYKTDYSSSSSGGASSTKKTTTKTESSSSSDTASSTTSESTGTKKKAAGGGGCGGSCACH